MWNKCVRQLALSNLSSELARTANLVVLFTSVVHNSDGSAEMNVSAFDCHQQIFINRNETYMYDT